MPSSLSVEGEDSSDQRYIARRTRSGTGRLLSFAVTPSAPRKARSKVNRSRAAPVSGPTKPWERWRSVPLRGRARLLRRPALVRTDVAVGVVGRGGVAYPVEACGPRDLAAVA